MIKLEVFTFSFERLGMVEKYDSLQYVQQFQDQGSFQLVCPKTKENVELLQSNRFIWPIKNKASRQHKSKYYYQ